MKRLIWIPILASLTGVAQAGKADDTLVWSTEVAVDSADFYYQNVMENFILAYHICDSLVQRDVVNGGYEPLLATSYDWVDELTLDFTLRQGVKFHDGKPFSAEDVVYTFTHTSNPDHNVSFPLSVEWVESVEALAEDKVRFHFKTPTPAVMEYLSGVTPIYPVGHYDAAPEIQGPGGAKLRDWGAVVPNCTGPYKVAEFVPGERVVLEKNSDYFTGGPKGTPKIGKLVFRTITDQQALLAELITGGVDWVYSLPRDTAESLNNMGHISMSSGPTLRVSAISMDAAGRSGPNPFQDVRVRRAVNHAIDRDAMAKNLVGEEAKVIHTACYPSQVGCTDEGATRYEYNPEKAKQLLAEAGYPDGFTVTIHAYRDRPHVEAIVGYLHAVGINAQLNLIQYSAFKPLMQEGNTSLAHMSWGSAGINDVSAITSAWFRETADDYAQDAELHEWLGIADTSNDPEVRKEHYRKALLKIAEEAYWVPLFSQVRYYTYTSDLDFTPSPDEIPHFYRSQWK